MSTDPASPARHWEWQYLDLMRGIWEHGDERIDRTGVGTRSVFGPQLRFDLSDGCVPLLTTKRVYWKAAAREMLWFLTGETNIRPLLQQGVTIWSDWPPARNSPKRRSSGESSTMPRSPRAGATLVRSTASNGSTGRLTNRQPTAASP